MRLKPKGVGGFLRWMANSIQLTKGRMGIRLGIFVVLYDEAWSCGGDATLKFMG